MLASNLSDIFLSSNSHKQKTTVTGKQLFDKLEQSEHYNDIYSSQRPLERRLNRLRLLRGQDKSTF